MSEQTFIRVVNWERFQHYKHRNPPWIKLYCEMLSSQTWVTLDDQNRVLAFAILMLAARHDNKIPMDPAYIRRVAYLNSEPTFDVLLAVAFIQIIPASTLHCVASNLRTNALPETETEKIQSKRQRRDREREREESENATTKSTAKALTKMENQGQSTTKPKPTTTAKSCEYCGGSAAGEFVGFLGSNAKLWLCSNCVGRVSPAQVEAKQRRRNAA